MAAAAKVGDFLRSVGYGVIAHSLPRTGRDQVFPDFLELQRRLATLAPFYRFLYSLLWQGHEVNSASLKAALPSSIIDALQTCGLVMPEGPNFRTPGMAIVPFEGLLLTVAIPPQYPTAAWSKQPIYIGPDSFYLAGLFPPSMQGKRILDVCAGSGIQGLICLSRGAASATALEKNPAAAAVASLNAAINGLADRYEILESDLFSALDPSLTFDVVVSNPPFMPVMESIDYPICGAGGADGTELLSKIVVALPRLVKQDGGQAYVIANCLGSQTGINCNRDVVSAVAVDGFTVRSVVRDKLPFPAYVRGVKHTLSLSCPEVSAEQHDRLIEEWVDELQSRGTPAEYVYLQLLSFERIDGSGRLDHFPTYPVRESDPLVRLMAGMGA